MQSHIQPFHKRILPNCRGGCAANMIYSASTFCQSGHLIVIWAHFRAVGEIHRTSSLLGVSAGLNRRLGTILNHSSPGMDPICGSERARFGRVTWSGPLAPLPILSTRTSSSMLAALPTPVLASGSPRPCLMDPRPRLSNPSSGERCKRSVKFKA